MVYPQDGSVLTDRVSFVAITLILTKASPLASLTFPTIEPQAT